MNFNATHALVDLVDKDRPGPRLKVWWIPQVPMKSFDVFVNSYAEAHVLLRALAQYDLFQLDNRIKPDFANAGGVMIDEDGSGEYTDYYEDESGREFDELTLHQCVELDQKYAPETVDPLAMVTLRETLGKTR